MDGGMVLVELIMLIAVTTKRSTKYKISPEENVFGPSKLFQPTCEAKSLKNKIAKQLKYAES
ncbi:hypothetical protein HanPSC8_Chr16g0702441 [Helianthus annuus]|nr:hypothetical protein HanPSC8_Chr16g0702441 [Helianthus annuus]